MRRARRPPSGRTPRHGASRLIDHFEQQSARCTGIEELRSLLGNVTRELGFTYFALLHHASLGAQATRCIRLDNYPEDWERELLAHHEWTEDPVHAASRRALIGFRWSDLGALVELSAVQQRILEGSRRHGLGEGYTVPANIPGEPAGSCSFATRSGQALPEDRLLCAEQVGAHAFQVARRLRGLARPAARARLSRRELQCLRLLAAGKSDWEISVILGISSETARQYVKHARAVYDVVTRTQLVVHGLRDALISFEDAIPPDG